MFVVSFSFCALRQMVVSGQIFVGAKRNSEQKQTKRGRKSEWKFEESPNETEPLFVGPFFCRRIYAINCKSLFSRLAKGSLTYSFLATVAAPFWFGALYLGGGVTIIVLFPPPKVRPSIPARAGGWWWRQFQPPDQPLPWGASQLTTSRGGGLPHNLKSLLIMVYPQKSRRKCVLLVIWGWMSFAFS